MSLASFLYRTARFICVVTPRPLAKVIIPPCSKVWAIAARHRLENVRENLRVLGVPEGQINKTSYRVFENFGYLLWEFFSGLKGTRCIRNQVEADEIIGKLFGPPGECRGGIILSPHTGNWEINLRYLLEKGYRVFSVIQKHSDPDVDRFFHEMRSHPNFEYSKVEHGLLPALKALREGRIVALACERAYGVKGIPLTLFGRKVPFPAGGAFLHLKSKKPILIVNAERIEIGKIVVDAENLSVDLDPKKKNPSTSLIVEEIAQNLFSHIQQLPDQWVTFDRYFEQSVS